MQTEGSHVVVAVVRLAGRATATTGALVALCALLFGEVATHGRRLWHQRGLLEFDDLVLLCAWVVLVAAAGRLVLSTGLTVVTRLPACAHAAAGRLVRRITPALCRGVLGGACGAVLVAPSVVLPATAGTAALPVPDRPVQRHVPVTATPATVRVRPGDTLWAIAARRLPRAAGDARVARAWPVWFHRNRGAIGPDPHLIHPGTRLTAPPRFR